MNVIYNENCLNTMKRMDAESIDMVLTSPPYDNLRKYKGYSFEFEPIAQELFRILKQGGTIVWVVADSVKDGSESGTSFRQALYFMEAGFKLWDTMIFAKVNPVPLNHRRYEQAFEYMFVLTKGKPAVFNPIKIPCKHAGKIESYGYGRRKNYGKEHSWRADNFFLKEISEDKQAPNIFYYVLAGVPTGGHEAPFPIKLACDMVSSWSSPGALVYDPFMGSGTTAIACRMLGRNYLGSEISAEYCRMAEKRLDGFLGYNYE